MVANLKHKCRLLFLMTMRKNSSLPRLVRCFERNDWENWSNGFLESDRQVLEKVEVAT